jgi:hypothetical protein
MIGLAGLPDGCHHLATPIGRLFLRVRGGRVQWVELSPPEGVEVKVWPATKATIAAIAFARTGELLTEGVKPIA